MTRQYVKTRYTSSIIIYFISFFPVFKYKSLLQGSLHACFLDSLPCIPDSRWILDSNLKFRISRANFSHVLDAPKFSPHSGIRSPLHGATRPCHFTIALISPRWLSSTNSSLLSTSPKGLTWLAICNVRKDYFSKFWCQESYSVPSLLRDQNC